jgi:ABC-2 type transport system ATP-binding protein
LIKLENVEKRFKGANRSSLTNLSAGIKAGLITGLVGPDGAGKTTLMRLMAGLLSPTSGQVLVRYPTTSGAGVSSPVEYLGGQGTSLAALTVSDAPHEEDFHPPTRETARDFIGYMPQKFGLYEDLSVLENLNLHADLRGILGADRESAFKRLLEFTDLTRFTGRFAGKLSGGMKQKLGLACALLGHPKILLLDEPGVGVDPISRRELWKMVHELIGEGMTVVWSTAYLDEAELCGEVLLLNEGRLLFAGKPSELTDRLRNRCFQIRHVGGNRRQLLARVLRRPEVLDGVIQGRNVRLVLRQAANRPDLRELAAGDESQLVATPPRFEDAFIDELGGGPGGESTLAQRMRNIAGADDSVVEAIDLTKKFGDFAATDHVSFAVKRGEIFGLLGPNGAGKSTTFRMMCGLLTPTSGTAHLMGIDLRKSPSQARQRLGYMAQKFSLYGNLTVLQNLNFFSGVYGLRGPHQKQLVEGMIQAFKLEPFLKATADALPLGFKQRLALSCAVMHEPDVLFLDEPTSGVDPVTRREFWTHINGLVEKGVTVVVTTHFMDEAEYCDRIALVFHGKIIAAGTPDHLKGQAVTTEMPDPSMEDAFIELIRKQNAPAA